MAFSFFKKVEYADVIFLGGRILTRSADLPEVGACAVKDGKVMALGDEEDIRALEGSETEVVDLEGGYMLPGFISVTAHPALELFRDSALWLDEGMTLDEVLAAVKKYVKANPSREAYLVYGYDPAVIGGMEPVEARERMDEACPDKPLLALSRSGLHAWLNTAILDLARGVIAEEQAVQEEEGDDKPMPPITVTFLLSIISPFSEGELEKKFAAILKKYAEHGFTTVLDNDSPEYFDSIYQEYLTAMLENGAPKQRYFGAFWLPAPADPASVAQMLRRKSVSCAELDGYLNYDTLKITLGTKAGVAEAPEDENGGALNFTPEQLSQEIAAACEYGFNVLVDARDKLAADTALETLMNARNSGYRRTVFTLAHGGEFTEEELTDTTLGEDIYEGILTRPLTGTVEDIYVSVSESEDTDEAIDALTIDAAIQLGAEDRLGTIEVGKYADFAVFDTDPTAVSIDEFKKLKCAMTVLSGEIAYDAEDDDSAEWADMIAAPDFSGDFDEEYEE